MPDLSDAQFGNVVPILGQRGGELDAPVCEDCNMGGGKFGVKQRMDPIQKRPRQLCRECHHDLTNEADWQEADRAERKSRLSVVRA